MVETVPFEFDPDSSGDDDIAELEHSGGDDDMGEDVAMAEVEQKTILEDLDISATMPPCLKIGKGTNNIEEDAAIYCDSALPMPISEAAKDRQAPCFSTHQATQAARPPLEEMDRHMGVRIS